MRPSLWIGCQYLLDTLAVGDDMTLIVDLDLGGQRVFAFTRYSEHAHHHVTSPPARHDHAHQHAQSSIVRHENANQHVKQH